MSHLVRRRSTHTHQAMHRYVCMKIFGEDCRILSQANFLLFACFSACGSNMSHIQFALLVFSFFCWRLNSPVAWIIFPFITSALYNGISIDSVKTWRNGKQHGMVFYVNLIVRIRRKYTHGSYKTNLVLCIWMPQPRSRSPCLAKMSSEITSAFFFRSSRLSTIDVVWAVECGYAMWVCFFLFRLTFYLFFLFIQFVLYLNNQAAYCLLGNGSISSEIFNWTNSIEVKKIRWCWFDMEWNRCVFAVQW